MLLHKVGDKVKIRSDLKFLYEQDPWRVYYCKYKNGEKSRYNVPINFEMTKFANKIVTISELRYEGDSGYCIEEDGNNYIWTDDMFENINPFDFESLI